MVTFFSVTSGENDRVGRGEARRELLQADRSDPIGADPPGRDERNARGGKVSRAKGGIIQGELHEYNSRLTRRDNA